MTRLVEARKWAVPLMCGAAFIWASPASAQLAFMDRSHALPVPHIYDGGWTHFVGGGVAVFDCNDDGLAEVYAAGGESPSHLFLNMSAPGGEISFQVGAFDDLTHVIGAYPIDVDSDGVLDLFIMRNGENVLMKGLGACQFAPAPQDWAFDGGNDWTTSFSATFEVGQSWPTLAIGNYVDQTNPEGPFEACDTNYLIAPDGHRFGLPLPLKPGFCALSMLFSDWQRTGETHLRISNDRHYYVRAGQEQMWRLNPLHNLTEAEGWPRLMLWGMGIASRDLTGDGLPEIVLTSMGDQMLQINLGGGLMKAAPYETGTYATTPYSGDDGRPSTGWHAQFGDLNNDGLDDLFIAKGNVDQMPSNAIHDPNNLLIQQADGTFTEMGGVTGLGTAERSRGAALVDLNNDGLLDVVVINRRAPMEIWQNQTTQAGHWLAIDVRQDGANTRAIGGFVEVRLPNGRVLTQELTIGGGHASGIAGPLHFGLGDAGAVDVRVTWPHQSAGSWETVAANQIIRLTRDVPVGSSGQ